jgi:uncharacterized protein (TIGR02453 family)
MNSYLSPEFHSFFKDLAANNDRDWFHANKKRYESAVKLPFNSLVEAILSRFTEIDQDFKEIEAKDCIFRINRDIRFSNDKSPYKLYASAVIAKGGRKSRSLDGIYLECSPEHTRIYGGIYELDSSTLKEFRVVLADHLDEFRSIYSQKDFKSVFGNILGERNKILPKELRTAAENEPMLFNKQWYFFREMPAEIVCDPKFIDTVLETYLKARPLEQFFQKILNSITQ